MIRCTTKPDKFKNLTLNKEYDATEENDNYVLLNDAGISARYAKKYFTAVVARLVPQLLVDVLTVEEVNNDENVISIDVTIGHHRTVRMDLDIYSTSISCGIDYLSGISEVKGACSNLYNRLDHNLYTGTLADLFRYVVEYMLQNISELAGACYIMSDQANREGEDQSMNVVLTSLSDTNWTGINNNSDNEIIVWIFNK